MELKELQLGQLLNVKIVWGEVELEFHTTPINKEENGVIVKPYEHDGKPLVIDVDKDSDIYANLYTNHPVNGERITWKNIKLNTVERDGKTVYFLDTMGVKTSAKAKERREGKRLPVEQKGQVVNGIGEKPREILIHDISDNGISFYANDDFNPTSSVVYISFQDSVSESNFKLKAECQIMFTKKEEGRTFYGCEILNVNHDFLLYGCLKRLKLGKNEVQ